MKLAAGLPQSPNHNGLTAIARGLIADPFEQHLVIAMIDTKTITVDTDSGMEIPTVRVRRIEAVLEDDRTAAAELLTRAQTARLGEPLDLDGGEER